MCNDTTVMTNDVTCTHECLTWLVNQPQQKQTEQFLALILTWIISALI